MTAPSPKVAVRVTQPRLRNVSPLRTVSVEESLFLMSSLISSFFIEPVVRQARKFSAARSGDDGCPEAEQSHVRQTLSATAEPTSTQTVVITSGNHINTASRLGHAVFDRFVPLWSSNASRQPQPQQPPPSTELVDNEPVETEDPTYEHSHDPITQPILADAVREAGMRSNPLYGLAESLRPAEEQDSTLSRRQRTRSGSGRRSRRNTGRDVQHPAVLRDETPSLYGSLPEDDGMKALRQQMHEIRDTAASSEDKARKMHALMTQDWNVWQARLRAQSPASFVSQDRSLPPTSPQSPLVSNAEVRTLASSRLSVASTLNPLDPYGLTPEDLIPSYRPTQHEEDENATASAPGNTTEPIQTSDPNFGCKHYKRNVKIQCFDCKRWFPCRHCHDEAYAEQGDSEHKLNRRKTENMLCMLCQMPQPASQTCRECGKRAAYYYCDLCKLWDDTSTKRIYHCGECGICRLGEGLGKDYIHCKVCSNYGCLATV